MTFVLKTLISLLVIFNSQFCFSGSASSKPTVLLSSTKISGQSNFKYMVSDFANYIRYNGAKVGFRHWAHICSKDIEKDLGEDFDVSIVEGVDAITNQFELLTWTIGVANKISSIRHSDKDPYSFLDENGWFNRIALDQNQKTIILPMVRKQGACSIEFMNHLFEHNVFVVGIATDKELNFPQAGHQEIKKAISFLNHDFFHLSSILTESGHCRTDINIRIPSNLNKFENTLYSHLFFYIWHENFKPVTWLDGLGHDKNVKQFKDRLKSWIGKEFEEEIELTSVENLRESAK